MKKLRWLLGVVTDPDLALELWTAIVLLIVAVIFLATGTAP